jgi:long-chain acyl-CoA synthetase
MAESPWYASYPRGVPARIGPPADPTIVDVLRSACARYADRPCYSNMGTTLRYRDLDRLSGQFAAFLTHELGLAPGDRIALQMPNLLQYPVALFGALRAGLVVVNTNPLYTPREMAHQLGDAGVKAVVILANFARNLEEVLPAIGQPRVVITQVGDLLPGPKRLLVNAAVRHLKRLVPRYSIPGAISFPRAMALGRTRPPASAAPAPSDLAFLQYTGGTTGVAKGAMLTHANVVANMEQALAWMATRFTAGEEVVVTPLPLYHIFSLTVNCLLFLKYGAHNLLVTNPRDVDGFVKLLAGQPFTVMTAVNTLLGALLRHPRFLTLDLRRLKVTVAGAMALHPAVAEKWKAVTGTPVLEGYGLTEASPVVCCNPVDGTERVGTIGLPLPSTEVRIVDDAGQDVAPGDPGELLVRGPQVMQGYWKRPDETALVLRDGWLWTGDVARMEEGGFFRIVDRKKDMILVSGFNVYPNEIEEVVAQHPGVLEVGAIGVPDDRSGEAVKIVVVKKDPALGADELIAFCRQRLAGYKIPRQVEFRSELPKTNIGKILRRALT